MVVYTRPIQSQLLRSVDQPTMPWWINQALSGMLLRAIGNTLNRHGKKIPIWRLGNSDGTSSHVFPLRTGLNKTRRENDSTAFKPLYNPFLICKMSHAQTWIILCPLGCIRSCKLIAEFLNIYETSQRADVKCKTCTFGKSFEEMATQVLTRTLQVNVAYTNGSFDKQHLEHTS